MPNVQPRNVTPLSEALSALAVARYEIVLRAVTEAHLPHFTGAMLRGAFGFALKRAVCAMPHGDCGNCMLAPRCVYPHTFETRWPTQDETRPQQTEAPHPFVLHAPVFPRSPRPDGEAERRGDGETERRGDTQHLLPGGSELAFTLTLMGRAIESLPYIVYALHELAERGLTIRRHRFALAAVNALAPNGERQTIYKADSQQLTATASATLNDYVTARVNQWSVEGGVRSAECREPNTEFESAHIAPALPLPHALPLSVAPSSVKLSFLTPTRFKVDGQLQWRTDFPLLARNLMRRVTLALRAHGDAERWAKQWIDVPGILAQATAVTSANEYLRWWDFGRYSTRQQTEMKLGGFVGNVSFSGATLPDFLPLLAAGECLGVGSATTFGLGQYRVNATASDNSQHLRALV